MRLVVIVTAIFLFGAQSLAWGVAPQLLEQQRRIQRTVIEQGVDEQMIAQQIAQQMAQQAVEQAAVQATQDLMVQGAQQAARQAFDQAAQNGIDIGQDVVVAAKFRKPRPPAGEEYVVEMADVLKSLERSSEAWALIIDQEPKGFIISKYVDYFKARGAMIKKPVEHYITLLDNMSAESPEMLKNPFKNIFQLIAVLEYDFDNGQDKDQMIISLIGKEAYLQNKQRLEAR